MLKHLKHRRGVTEIERTFLALGLAATPEERWDINTYFVKRLPLVARQAMEKESLEAALAHQRLQRIK
jgi:hypothetical protein